MPTSPHERFTNGLLDFWKLPSSAARLFVRHPSATFIGPEGSVPPGLHEATPGELRLWKLEGSGASLFCAPAKLAVPERFQPFLTAEGGTCLAWSDAAHRRFLFAFDVDQAVLSLLKEEYRTLDSGAARVQALHKLYYRLRPFIPRAIQMRMKHGYAKVQKAMEFPAWPIERSLDDFRELLLWCIIRATHAEQLTSLELWPQGKRFAVLLTHDVEQSGGVSNIGPLAELEKRFGMRSSWNFVPERYPFDKAILSRLQAEGFEIGVHGLTHDGRLFESRKIFLQRAPRINEYARQWHASGFRSPACHRIFEWMETEDLDFAYDSSFPDTDPYQPMPGGCCTVFPWFLGSKVEMPVSVPQDHLVWDVLGDMSGEAWRSKIDYIAARGGLAVVIVHPDYVTDHQRLGEYERLLQYVASREGAWVTLPATLAGWWRRRAATAFDGALPTQESSSDLRLSVASVSAEETPGRLRWNR